MATIDEDLGHLEKDIRQLKIEYDAFFGGGRKRPPTEIEWRCDLLLKRYSERGGDMKYGQRFRFNNLAQTYAKYKDIFRKRLAQREPTSEAPAAGAAEARAFRVVCSDPEKETEKVDQLYSAFLQAKQNAGEETSKLSK